MPIDTQIVDSFCVLLKNIGLLNKRYITEKKEQKTKKKHSKTIFSIRLLTHVHVYINPQLQRHGTQVDHERNSRQLPPSASLVTHAHHPHICMTVVLNSTKSSLVHHTRATLIINNKGITIISIDRNVMSLMIVF